MPKVYLDQNVYDAAIDRINYVFDNYEKMYVSFSAGKDSTVMLHMVMNEAVKRGKPSVYLLLTWKVNTSLP